MSNYVVGGEKKKKKEGEKSRDSAAALPPIRFLVHHHAMEAVEGKKISINSVTARAAAQAGSDANLRVSQPLNGSSAMFS